MISPEQCQSIAKGKMIHSADQLLAVETATKNTVVITDSSTSGANRNHCNWRGWITHDMILSHLQPTTLKIRMPFGRVLSESPQVLPCALEELGCETISLDPYAYMCTTQTTVYYQSSEPKMFTWWNRERNIAIWVEPIQQLNLYSKLKTTLKKLWKADRYLTNQLRLTLCWIT